ncbi:hypothetical protein GCM10027037_03210 [Mucilaginibacter koreensis]
MHQTQILSCEQLLEVFSSSHIATAIYTSEELIIEAVTREMLKSWGKDRSVVGQSLKAALPELEDQPFFAQLQSVWRTGAPITGMGVPAQLLLDGELQTRYYDYEYRAIRNVANAVYCILHTSTDVTDRELGLEAQRRDQEKQEALDREQALNEELAASNEELAASNEEIAAAMEELSSINEELQQTQGTLQALNNELEARVLERTQELAEREASLNYIIDGAPVAIAVLKGTTLLIRSANEFMLKIWGRTTAVIGQSIYDELPELGEQGIFGLLENVWQSGEAFSGSEVPSMMSDGAGGQRTIYTNFVFKPLKGDQGRTHSILMVASEVTQQVQHRLASEAARHRFQSMVTTTPVAMTILKGKELIVEIANEPMLSVWRRTADQVLGKGLVEIFPELRDQPNPQRMRSVFDTGKPVSLPETPVMLASTDGVLHTHHAKFSYDPIFDQQGKVESVLVTVIDITEAVANRKQLERSQAALQKTTNELATLNEELAAANEEMTASNEELVRVNEELSASARQLQQLNDTLSESEQRFRQMAEGSGILIGVGNAAGDVTYFNQAWSRLTGRTMEHLLTWGWSDLIHPEDKEDYIRLYMTSVENRVPYTGEYRILSATGVYRWLYAFASPRFEADGTFAGFIGSCIDITDRKEDEQRKSAFISMVSHELKTPLTSTVSYVQVAQKKALTSSDTLVAGMMERAGKQLGKMTRMINGFLNVSRLESSQILINPVRFDLGELLIEAHEEATARVSSHRILVEQAGEAWVNGDRDKIGQVIDNLISNAVKYSPAGSLIKLSCTLENGQAVVRVQDQGMGISAEHLPKLFERYYRVNEPGYQQVAGFGIGLYLCGEIIKRHEGKIWAESEPGKGSTFGFILAVV